MLTYALFVFYFLLGAVFDVWCGKATVIADKIANNFVSAASENRFAVTTLFYLMLWLLGTAVTFYILYLVTSGRDSDPRLALGIFTGGFTVAHLVQRYRETGSL